VPLTRALATGAIVVTTLMGGPALGAETAGARPEIVGLAWTTRPLTVGAVEGLEIRAVDPDGVVTSVTVAWGDGLITHADLICFESGEVARVFLTHRYESAGAFRVRVIARSGPRCFTTQQTSPEEGAWALVRPRSN
jgi:hypothetical protein